jgi:hypothetical protein
MYTFLADVIVAVHFAYIGFVIFGQLAIVVGAILGWKWIRDPAFRWIHLVMICVVALEAFVQFECPLTTWERLLRREKWREFMPVIEAARSLGLTSCPAGLGYLPATAVMDDDRIPEQAGTFIGRCFDSIVFVDCTESQMVPIYYGFALMVIALFILAPPRRRSMVRAAGSAQ